MIYTTYFANLKKINPNIVPVAICAKMPDGVNCLHYKRLAPKYDAFMKYKNDGDFKSFSDSYKKEVLDTISPISIVNELSSLTGLNVFMSDICLVCFEKNPNECHRSLVAEYLNKNNIKVVEL